jgi:hypothetical protein
MLFVWLFKLTLSKRYQILLFAISLIFPQSKHINNNIDACTPKYTHIRASGGSKILSKGVSHKKFHIQFDKLIYQIDKKSHNLQHNSVYMH